MKIFVVGTRGIPGVLGGVETHCEELYPRLVLAYGHDVSVLCRRPYVKDKTLKSFKGVNLIQLFAPKSTAFEAIVHSFLCIAYAAVKRPDVVHVHAVGPSLVVPFAKLLGLRVVMTHHGPDYNRKKWGKMAKLFLRKGEEFGSKYADSVIVISREIQKSLRDRFGTKAELIPNGVSQAVLSKSTEALNAYSLVPGQYIFALGRFVPEKGFDYLIRAYKKSPVSKTHKLVIAGDADHESEYSTDLKRLARKEGIVLTGFIKGDTLHQLFANSALFVLPSFYEGLPISLLEAMSFKLPVLASDIEANKEVELPLNCYFPVGDEETLSQKFADALEHRGPIAYNMDRYEWNRIAEETARVYTKVCS